MTHMALQLAAQCMAPGGRRGRLAILIYHRVVAQADPFDQDNVDSVLFERQMRALAETFNILSLREAVARLAVDSLPPRAVCVTFDDGYADNHDIALPILKRTGVHATFFIATGYLNGGRMWNDSITESLRRASAARIDLTDLGLDAYPLVTESQRVHAARCVISAIKHLPADARQAKTERIIDRAGESLPGNLMMTDDQVRALHAAGMGIGGHTATHPILSRLDIRAARDEIQGGRKYLEALVREPIDLFAYPNGRPNHDYTREHVALVRRLGFAAAVSTAAGVARKDSDWYQLPRFTPWDRGPGRFLFRLLRNYRTPVMLA